MARPEHPPVSQTQLLSGSGEDACATRHLDALENREISGGGERYPGSLLKYLLCVLGFTLHRIFCGSYY